METPLAAFKFGRPPVTGTPLIVRMCDALIDLGRRFLTPSFFEANAQILTRAGLYGLPVAAGLGFLFSMTVAVKLDTFSTFLVGFAWIPLILFVQYTAANFAAAGEGVIQSSPSQLGSFAFLNCLALLGFVSGWVFLFTGLFRAVKTEDMSLLWSGLGLFLLCEYLTAVAMNPSLVNVTIAPRLAAGEEAVGILSFLLKALLRLVPIAFGAGVILGTLSMGYDYVLFLAKDWYPAMAFERASLSAGWVLQAGLLPFLGFVTFAVLYLVVNLIRGSLLIPGKLDALLRQLPASLENVRESRRDD